MTAKIYYVFVYIR